MRNFKYPKIFPKKCVLVSEKSLKSHCFENFQSNRALMFVYKRELIATLTFYIVKILFASYNNKTKCYYPSFFFHFFLTSYDFYKNTCECQNSYFKAMQYKIGGQSLSYYIICIILNGAKILLVIGLASFIFSNCVNILSKMSFGQ